MTSRLCHLSTSCPSLVLSNRFSESERERRKKINCNKSSSSSSIRPTEGTWSGFDILTEARKRLTGRRRRRRMPVSDTKAIHLSERRDERSRGEERRSSDGNNIDCCCNRRQYLFPRSQIERNYLSCRLSSGGSVSDQIFCQIKFQ